MNTKAITLTIVFAALTVALNPDLTRIFFPAPYAPFLIYQIWEIPIVAAFILVSPKSGLAISALNAVVLLAIFPGASPLGPFYNLAAILSMLLGIYRSTKNLRQETITRKHFWKSLEIQYCNGNCLHLHGYCISSRHHGCGKLYNTEI